MVLYWNTFYFTALFVLLWNLAWFCMFAHYAADIASSRKGDINWRRRQPHFLLSGNFLRRSLGMHKMLSLVTRTKMLILGVVNCVWQTGGPLPARCLSICVLLQLTLCRKSQCEPSLQPCMVLFVLGEGLYCQPFKLIPKHLILLELSHMLTLEYLISISSIFFDYYMLSSVLVVQRAALCGRGRPLSGATYPTWEW